MCYSYGDREAMEEARKVARDKENRERREQPARKEAKEQPAPDRDRELVKS